jgi:outer membrane lipoprotein-sorting protein
MTMKPIPALLAMLAALAPLAPAQADPQASALVRRFLAVYDKATRFEGVVKVFCRHQGQTSETTYQLYLEKPNKSGFRVLEAPKKPGTVGTKLVWLGGPQVDVRTRFFGLPISLKADVTDLRLADLRGDTMADLNVVTAVAVLRAPDARYAYLGRQVVNGRTLERVELRSPRLLKGIRREVYGLDAETALPMVREMHDADGLAYQLTVERYKLDNVLPAHAFTLE